MKIRRIFPVLLLCAAPLGQGADTFRVAFGSCNKAVLPQPLWEPILAHQPDVWIWLGDIIYGDTRDMDKLRAAFALENENPGYARLKAATRIVGTWDDHDYGENNAGKEYPMKRESQQVLLDFLGEPPDSPRRRREGVYASYDFGKGDHRVKVILLDTRYYRDEPGEKGDILGEPQWQWLEAELRSSDAPVNLIGSSIQVIPAEHVFEKWANFPAARQRLVRVIARSGARGVIFLSGDRHQTEISRMVDEEGAPYPLYEITSSGLTHVAKGNTREPNRYRVAGPTAELNFGLVTIDWAAEPVTVRLEVRGVGDKELLEETVPLSAME